MKLALAILLLAVAGCRMDTTETPADRIERLRAASARAAAHADSVTNYPATPDSSRSEHANASAAKVAAVMAANDITLPQVATFLATYGFDVVNRASTLRPHWSPAPPGRDTQGNTVPVAYYVANIRIAVGDTTLAIYAPQAVGPVWMRVKAYDGRGMSGVWSVDEVSGSGDLLPGVAE
jgi:hypothetical protein